MGNDKDIDIAVWEEKEDKSKESPAIIQWKSCLEREMVDLLKDKAASKIDGYEDFPYQPFKKRIVENKDPFTVLGIEKTATKQEVTRAYRTLALQMHPSKYNGCSNDVKREVAALTRCLNEARNICYLYAKTNIIHPTASDNERTAVI